MKSQKEIDEKAQSITQNCTGSLNIAVGILLSAALIGWVHFTSTDLLWFGGGYALGVLLGALFLRWRLYR